MEVIARVHRVGCVYWLRGDDETLPLASLPSIDEMTMSAGALITKVAAAHAGTFLHERHSIVLVHLLPADRFFTAIPYAEDDPALGLTIYLHSEIATMPAAGHV